MATKKTAIAMPRMTAEDRAWKARNDLSTIQSADAIRSDPARLRAAQQEAKKQMEALNKIASKK